MCGDPATESGVVVWMAAVLVVLPAPVRATGEPKLTPSTWNWTEPVGAPVEPAEVLVIVAVNVTD